MFCCPLTFCVCLLVPTDSEVVTSSSLPHSDPPSQGASKHFLQGDNDVDMSGGCLLGKHTLVWCAWHFTCTFYGSCGITLSVSPRRKKQKYDHYNIKELYAFQ